MKGNLDVTRQVTHMLFDKFKTMADFQAELELLRRLRRKARGLDQEAAE